MHLVFLSSMVPLKDPGSGFDIANRVVVDALRLKGVRVTSIGFAPPVAEIAYPAETVLLGRQEITTGKASNADKMRWLAHAMRHGTTFSSAKMLAVSRARFASALAAAAPFDGVVLNSVQLPGAFLDALSGMPAIYLAHNVEHRSAAENAANATTAFERLLFRREARLLRRLEQELCDAARFVWTFTEDDRATLMGGRSAEAAVLPLVTSVEPPAGPAVEPRYDLGLIGTWTWQPNRVGLDWFLNAVTPHLDPGLSIAIAGNTGAPIEARHPGVRFLGRVADARAFARSARVVPLASRGGTGVQLKTIETFELGLPCVATASALRGIATIPDNCLRAEDPRDFAAALMRQVAASRGGKHVAANGASFHAGQMRGLMDGLEQGLAALGERQSTTVLNLDCNSDGSPGARHAMDGRTG